MTGRPTKLNAVLETRDDGTVVTVRDRIIEWLRIGMPRDTSCFRAGVTKATFHWWLREAARVEEVIALDPTRADDLTQFERDVLTFSKDVDEAVAEGEARYFGLLSQIARGNIATTKTVEKIDPQTNTVIERTVTVEHTLPSERALMWILERRYPANYPKGPQQIELAITGNTADPLTEQERAKALLNAIETTVAARKALPTGNGNGASPTK